MRNNLSLIKPNDYNKLFSSYHYNSKINKFRNNQLPKLSKLFPSYENNIQTSTFFNKTSKIKLEKTNEIKKKKTIYPLLNFSKDNDSYDKTYTNTDIIPLTTYHSYKLNNEKMNKLNKTKKNNNHQLNMIYLNLYKYPSYDGVNNHILNLDSFYNDIDNFEINKNNDENLSKKLKEINHKSFVRLNDIFNNTDFNKLNYDLMNINRISGDIIDKSIEKLLKNRRKKNVNKTDYNIIDDLDGERAVLVSNIFMDWILDNVKHKVELTNEYNEVLSTVWVKNLVYSEINELQNRFSEFRKTIKLSNFVKSMNNQRIKNILNKKGLKNNRSNFTASTFKSNYDTSNIKSFEHSSNIDSNYNNNSYENDKKYKFNKTHDKADTGLALGFDFFHSENKSKQNITYRNKQVISVNTPSVNHVNLINKMKNYKQSFIHSKYKTQNNDNNNKDNLWFKNVFLNNPRSNKIRNFSKNYENLASSIKSNNKFDPYSQRKKNKNENGNNDDIINRLIKESIHNTINVGRGLNYNYMPKNRYEQIKRVNSFSNKPSEKNYITIKSSFSNSSIRNRRSVFTPSKEVISNKDEEIGVKPKFKNIILRNLENKLYNDKITEEDKSNNYYSNSINKNDNNDMFNANKNNFKNGKDENNKEKNDKNKEQRNKGKKNRKKQEKKNKDIENVINKESKGNNSNQGKEKKKIDIFSYFEFSEEEKDENEKEIEKKDETSTINRKKTKRKSVFYFVNDLNIRNKRLKSENVTSQSNQSNDNNKKSENSSSKSNQEMEESEYKNENNESSTLNSLVRNELIKNMTNSLVVQKDKKRKPRGMLIKHNLNYKNEIVFRNNDEKQENNSFTSIYTLSSIDEKENLNEDKEIKEEVNLLQNVLNEKETYNLFNLVVLYKKFIRKKNKKEDNKKEMKSKKEEIFNIIQNYFDILLTEKLSIKEIKEDQVHFNILNQLKVLRKFGLFSSKKLLELQAKILKKRAKDLERYLNGEENWENISSKLFHRRNSAKLKSTRLEIFNRRKKKKKLIYNNLYLFKDNDSDNDKTNMQIKKEIYDILNTDYGNINNEARENNMMLEKRRKIKKEEKKKFIKIKKNDKPLARLKDEILNEEILKKLQKKDEKREKQTEKEDIRDKKIYEFFAKIQRLKRRQNLDNINEINSFIDEQIELNNEIPKEKDDGRLNTFLQEFLYQRSREKYAFDMKNKRITYMSPITFTSPHENCYLTQPFKFMTNKK